MARVRSRLYKRISRILLPNLVHIEFWSLLRRTDPASDKSASEADNSVDPEYIHLLPDTISVVPLILDREQQTKKRHANDTDVNQSNRT